MNHSKPQRSFLAWGILIFLSLVWGSSFILIKKSLVGLSPLQVGAGRIAITFLAFLPFIIKYLRQVKSKEWWPIMVVGICGSGLPAFLYATAQTHVQSGVAGILNALTPIFTYILALLIFGKVFTWRQLIGIIIGFVGTCIIFFVKEDSGFSFNWGYGLLIVLATFMYGISANTVGKFLQETKALIISAISFLFIGPIATIYLLSTDFIQVVTTTDIGMSSFLALATLALLSTFLANIVFFKLIQLTDPVFSASVSFIAPVIALVWGFWDGEFVSVFYVISLIMILYGVFLVKERSR